MNIDNNDPVTKRIVELYRKHQNLDVDIVLNDAKKKNSPLYNEFEWNDTEAAEKYRRIQATALISRYKVVIERENGGESVTRVFKAVKREDSGDSATMIKSLEDRTKDFDLALYNVNNLRTRILTQIDNLEPFRDMFPQVNQAIVVLRSGIDILSDIERVKEQAA